MPHPSASSLGGEPSLCSTRSRWPKSMHKPSPLSADTEVPEWLNKPPASRTDPSSSTGHHAVSHHHERSRSLHSAPISARKQPHGLRLSRSIEKLSSKETQVDGWGFPLSARVSSPSIRIPVNLSQPDPLHPDIRSVARLLDAHAAKIYKSGPLSQLERQHDGPVRLINSWAQLRGTTLCVWDLRQVEEASKQGVEVPPNYSNVTDAFIDVHDSIVIQVSPTSSRQICSNVFSLNVSGTNMSLFSCSNRQVLFSWVMALRLSVWEMARLEEIYTGHLIRIAIEGKSLRPSLVDGQIEGQVWIRLAGQTDWRKLWVVVSQGKQLPPIPPGADPKPSPQTRKLKLSFRKLRDRTIKSAVNPTISFYSSQNSKEDEKPVLTISHVTQTFAVFPHRRELINLSAIIKLEGTVGQEDMAETMKGREGWLLMMPEVSSASHKNAEMLKWITSIHEAFELYGRPLPYIWDVSDPLSLNFAYPTGPHRDQLFFDPDSLTSLDPRDASTSSVSYKLLNLLVSQMNAAKNGAK